MKSPARNHSDLSVGWAAGAGGSLLIHGMLLWLMPSFSFDQSTEKMRPVELTIAGARRPVPTKRDPKAAQPKHAESLGVDKRMRPVQRLVRPSHLARILTNETSTDEPAPLPEAPKEASPNATPLGPPAPAGLGFPAPSDASSFEEPSSDEPSGVRLRWLERSIKRGGPGPAGWSSAGKIPDRTPGRNETETPRETRDELGIPEPGRGQGSFDFYSPLDFNEEMAKARKKVAADKMKHEYHKNNDRGHGVVCNVNGRWFLCEGKSLSECNKVHDNLCRYGEKEEVEKLKADRFF